MDYFGINALDELPKLKEFEQRPLYRRPGDIIVSAEENDDHTITLKVSAERREDAQNQQHEENIEQTGGSEDRKVTKEKTQP